MNEVVAARWAAYRAELKVRRSQIAAARQAPAAAPVGARRERCRRSRSRGRRDRPPRRSPRWAPRWSCSSTRRAGVRRRSSTPARPKFHRLEASALALPRGLRALAAQPRRLAGGRPRPAPRARARAGRARADQRPLRPHRPRRARRCRLRPHLRARRARVRHPPRPPPRAAGGGIRLDGAHVELEAGVHLDLGGIAQGLRRRACRRPARGAPGHASSTPAATSRSAEGAGRWASRPPTAR